MKICVFGEIFICNVKMKNLGIKILNSNVPPKWIPSVQQLTHDVDGDVEPLNAHDVHDVDTLHVKLANINCN